jgi:hypothetical protein
VQGTGSRDETGHLPTTRYFGHGFPDFHIRITGCGRRESWNRELCGFAAWRERRTGFRIYPLLATRYFRQWFPDFLSSRAVFWEARCPHRAFRSLSEIPACPSRSSPACCGRRARCGRPAGPTRRDPRAVRPRNGAGRGPMPAAADGARWRKAGGRGQPSAARCGRLRRRWRVHPPRLPG